ncbi:MAG TPA: hypothetical protein PK493_03090 [Pseudomonadota bacterium]|nr:hypothetical protein [Pseudomonadota bacterium]
MKTLLSTLTSLVLSASLSSAAHAQTLDPSMDPNQQWQDGQGAEMYQAPDPNYQNYQADPNAYQNQVQQFGFFGPHPIAYDQGGGFCNHQGAHEHPYPVFDQNLFRMSSGYAYFIGDVGDFGYSQTGYQYVAEHPIGHIHGGGYCFMSWPHRHWFAPIGVNFVWSNAGYVYNGPWGSDYYSLRPRYVTYYNDYYRRWYLGGRYYSLRPSHTYIGFGWHRPMARPYYGGGGYYRPGYGGAVVRPAPVYRPPVYQNPGYRPGPVYQAPAYRPAPVYQAPAYRAPVYQAPAYRPAPVYSAPMHSAPVYRAPAYSAPMHSAPAYRAPAYSAPVHSAPAGVHHAHGWR